MDTFTLSPALSEVHITNAPIDLFNVINNKDIVVNSYIENNNWYKKFAWNAVPDYRKSGFVYPNITIHETKKWGKHLLFFHITFSGPKVLWGNSYKNPADTDRDPLLAILANRLSQMGAGIETTALLNSPIQTAHFATNILFPTATDAEIFLDRMSKVSIGKWFEKNIRSYSDAGRSVRFHTSTFEIIFYLKFTDPLNTKKSMIDRQTTLQEKRIAKEFHKSGIRPPVVRMEVRFIKSKSVSSHLKAVTGVDKLDWTFKDVFNTDLNIQVLKYYWQRIIDDPLNYYLLCATSDYDVCLRLQNAMKGEKSSYINEAKGMYLTLKTLGLKGLKEEIVSSHTRTTWYRKMKLLTDFLNKYVEYDDSLIKVVTEALDGKQSMEIQKLEKLVDTYSMPFI